MIKMKLIALIKTMLFHLLLSLRGIIVGISKLLALSCIGMIIATFYIEKLSDLPVRIKLEIAMLGIVLTAIYWFYDYVILCLRPKYYNQRYF